MRVDVGLLAVLVARGCPDELLDRAAELIHARTIAPTYRAAVAMVDDVILLARLERDE